ncbi:MAG: ATP-binding protein, partial [Candidatus Cryptobacteroides sp.]
AKAMEEAGPKLDVIEADWTCGGADTAFRKYLQDGGRPDIIFAHNDKMAAGARMAAESLGLCRDSKYIGVDAIVGDGLGVDMVENGILEASMMYPTGGEKVAQVVVSILGGTPYLLNNVLPTVIVTASNARVLTMQYRSIQNMDEKIRTLDNLMDSTMLRFDTQRKVLIVVLILFILVVLLLGASFWFIHRMRQLNAQLEEQKRQVERQREEKLAFFTNVSHDFRTPLTLIADPVNQLKKSSNLSENERYMLDLVGKNVTLLRRLVNQILDFRKYECGKLDLHLSEFDLVAAARDWTDAFSVVSWKKHINLVFEAEPEIAGKTIVADMEKVERITYNLLSNALEFTPERGMVKVEVGFGDGRFHLVVSDNGVGIAPDKIEHIFENFYQAHSVSYSGSGIGLALVKAFVDMHGGEIKVSSSEGGGIRFDVWLPCTQPETPAVGNADSAKMQVMQNGAKLEATTVRGEDAIGLSLPKNNSESKQALVLVIDDNADVRQYVSSILGRFYEVLEAADGEQGLKLAQKNMPDAVVCDVMMPVMDGMEFCRRLKSEMRTSHIPVMMLTAYAAEDQKIEGYNCGADSYISKPFGSELLLSRLRNLLQNRARLRGLYGDACQSGADRLSEPDKGFLAKLREAVMEHIEDSTLSVEMLGEQLCLSRVQLYRKTKALTGYSPNEYIRIIRLKTASDLLSSTENTVSEVAYSVGFTSPSYFAKCYKEYFGESPKAGRQK